MVKECIQEYGGKLVRKTSLERPRHKCEGNIKMDLREIEFGGMDWIHTAQVKDQCRDLVNTVLNLHVP